MKSRTNLRIKLLSRDRQPMQCVSECFVNFCYDDIVENVNWGPGKIPILKNKITEAVNSTVGLKTLSCKQCCTALHK